MTSFPPAGPDLPGRSDSTESHGFVRPAVPGDLEAIGAVHAAAMLASLERAHSTAHGGAPLPAGVAAMIAAPVLAAGWEGAVLSPPSSDHAVLVATEDGDVVGLLGLAPTSGTVSPDSPGPGEPDNEGVDDADAQRGVEITALGVAPDHQRRGHGSRLLAAASDLARDASAEVALVWAVSGDPSLEHFLATVGMSRTGSRRELPVGLGVVEECWAAAL